MIQHLTQRTKRIEIESGIAQLRFLRLEMETQALAADQEIFGYILIGTLEFSINPSGKIIIVDACAMQQCSTEIQKLFLKCFYWLSQSSISGKFLH